MPELLPAIIRHDCSINRQIWAGLARIEPIQRGFTEKKADFGYLANAKRGKDLPGL